MSRSSVKKNRLNKWPWQGEIDSEIYGLKETWPKISIVTPSYNQGQYIEETILSILNQNYPNLEYIIIDGGSKDNTIEIIKKYEDNLTYWISEPDKGQADAINKGLMRCSGDIFNWVNSDDLLAPSALIKIADKFDITKFEILAGAVLNDFTNEKTSIEIFFNKDLDISKILDVAARPFNYHQPGVWFKKSCLEELPKFNINMQYYFDWEFMLKFLSNYSSIIYIDDTLLWFRYHENSKTVALQQNYNHEILLCYKNLKDFLKKGHYLFKKAVKKYNTLLWHTDLLTKVKKDGYNSKTFMYILINILQHPNSKLTRLTIGQLRKFI